MEQQSLERFVKGTMVLDIVKTIHGFQDKPWDQYLSREAQDLLQQRILASAWYPYEPVINCLNAVYRLIGGNNPENARAWGRINGQQLFETAYKNLLMPGDPMESMKKLNILSATFFKGFVHASKELGPRHFEVQTFDDDPRTEAIYYLIQGWIDVLVENAGGKNAKVLIIQKHWEGNESTIIDIRWE
jgi:hypothetical protein